MRVDVTRQPEIMGIDRTAINHLRRSMTLCIDERGILTTLTTQSLHIYLSHLQLWLQGEPFSLSHQVTILENHGIATIHHILCALTKATTGIDVATNGAGTLLC